MTDIVNRATDITRVMELFQHKMARNGLTISNIITYAVNEAVNAAYTAGIERIPPPFPPDSEKIRDLESENKALRAANQSFKETEAFNTRVIDYLEVRKGYVEALEGRIEELETTIKTLDRLRT